MTINKSQDQSLKQVALYLPHPVFTHGQLYVAMSRVTTPSGLKILDETSDIDGEDGVTNIVYKEIFKDVRTTKVITTLYIMQLYQTYYLKSLITCSESKRHPYDFDVSSTNIVPKTTITIILILCTLFSVFTFHAHTTLIL